MSRRGGTGSSAVDPLIHGNLSAIGGDLGSSVPLGSIADPDKGTVDNIPRAYLGVIFFNSLSAVAETL